MAKQMAEKTEEPKIGITQNDTGTELATAGTTAAPDTCPETCPHASPDTGARQEPEADAGKPPRTGGEVFFAAVDMAFATDGDKLTKKLMEMAVDGNLWSAKLLIAAIEKVPRKQKADENGPGMAEHWAAEPQWNEALTEQTAEVGSGGREPEM